MACNDIVSAILHYKRNIDKICDPPERALKYEDRLLHCINKLYKLPVNVNHLQETGVGRTVNSLRKIEGEKGLGDAAKALVAKWKTMVMLEDEAERKQREEGVGPCEEDLCKIKLIREAEKFGHKETETNSSSQDLHSSSYDNNTRSHSGAGTVKKHKNETNDLGGRSRKRKWESDEEDRRPLKNGDGTNIANVPGSQDNRTSHDRNEKRKSLSNHASSGMSSKSHEDRSASKSAPSNSSKSHDSAPKKNGEKSKEGKSGKTDGSPDWKSPRNESNERKFSSKQRHENKSKKKDKEEFAENDGFDSHSGASFADALGPIIVKKSPKKKSGHGSSAAAAAAAAAAASPAFSDQSSDGCPLAGKDKKKEVKNVDALFPQHNLEPLEADLVATLPTPTPYYKPHPSYVPGQEAAKKRVQAEEDALTTIMSNKNSRTKVYSGVKGGLSYVPSLYECCCRVLQQHIDALEYTGGIPFSLLKPILEGATPSQLYQFEHFNPYIIEDTDDLWKFHVNKEFRSQKRQEFESWRDMYLRCVDEREEKYKAVTANIIQRTIENSVPVRKAKLAYIDVAKPPRNILRKQMKNGTGKPDANRLLGKNDPEAVKVSAPKHAATAKEPAAFKVKPKVAPLMQKTLKSIKMSRFKR